MIDDTDDDLDDRVLDHCIVPNCRGEAAGLYCERHLRQLARLDTEPDEQPEPPPRAA